MPPLPIALHTLELSYMPNLASLPALPSGLLLLTLSGLPALTSISPLPVSISTLILHEVGAAQLPPLPPALDLLIVQACGQLSAIPQLPAGLRDVRLLGLPALSALPAWPLTCERLSLNNLPLVSAVPAIPATAQAVSIGGMPLLPAWPEIPQGVTELGLYSQDFAALPPLNAGLSSLALGSLPSIGVLPPLPPMLSNLELYSMPGITGLPPLPATLMWLRLEECPNLQAVPLLPDGMLALYLINCDAVPCLPNLPFDLWDLTIQSSTITCLPNAVSETTWMELTPGIQGICDEPCGTGLATLGGRVMHDTNGNGLIDAGEQPLPGAVITIQPLGIEAGTNAAGEYRMQVPLGAYSVSASMPAAFPSTSAPATIIMEVLEAGAMDTTGHFAMALESGHHDLSLSLAGTDARPGFSNIIWLQVRNQGSEPLAGTVTLSPDALQSFTTAVPPPTATGGGTLSWMVPELQVGQQWIAQVNLLTAVGTPLGAALLATALVESLGDEVMDNDAATLEQVVVGSFDPNDKLVSPTGLSVEQLASGERLDYTIRFQNTGTAPAEFVVIEDTLSPLLVASSFAFIGSSHACTWERDGHLLRFRFNDIQLPDSVSDEPGSHGFARFTIAPVASLLPGASIANTAHIYFDYNEAVVTEPAICEVLLQTEAAGVGKDRLLCYPNPASDWIHLNVPMECVGRNVEVLDAKGRYLMSARVNGASFSIDVSSLSTGPYMIRLLACEGPVHGLFMKE